MKIGYPCINTSIVRETPSTFRLASYNEDCLVKVVRNNLDHLEKILHYNVKNNLLFFRISSGLIPFASHPVCKVNWQKHFAHRFKGLGEFIKENKIRISMHADQFVLINLPKEQIVERSVRELTYHCSLFANHKRSYLPRSKYSFWTQFIEVVMKSHPVGRFVHFVDLFSHGHHYHY